MCKVIWCNFPAHGSTNPLLSTLKELVSRGVEIIYFSGNQFRSKVETTGVDFRGYKGNINSLKHDNQKDEISLLKFMMEITLDKLDSNFEEIKRMRPDFIIHDSVCPWGKVISKILNIPALNLMHTFPMTADSMAKNLESWKIIPGALRYTLKSFFNRKSPLQIIKRKYKQNISLTDIMINNEVLNIIYSSSLMNPEISEKEDSYYFAGPSIVKTNGSDDFPWERISPKKTIYISLGTVTNKDINFYKKCIRAFKNSDFQIVMSIGDEIDIKDIGTIPENFIVQTMVPQWKLLGKVELFITNAGMNSVHESLLNGVPMLMFPDQIEKKMIADRISFLRAGIILNIKQFTAKQLLSNATTILENAEFKMAAAKYRNILQAEEKVSHINAADKIIEHMESLGLQSH